MNRQLTCIECPVGCSLSVDHQANKVITVTGNKCPKGQAYAVAEVENPVRILTATIICTGLSLKMLPVRTSKPIPKDKLLQAMEALRAIHITKPVHLGEVIVSDFLGLGVDIIATRENLL